MCGGSKLKILMLILVSFISGCSTYGSWRPVVDHTYSNNAQFLQRDLMECEMLAKEASSTFTETLKGGAVGGAVGAAGGAAIGAIVGDPLKGAALGSVLGIGSGAYSGMNADSRYRLAYINCMRNRGHNVVN